MLPTSYRFIEPLDVLFLRGNRLFGDPGSDGESLVPPWPSVAAGALRSRLLADEGVDLAAYAAGRVAHAGLGTPGAPGPFTVTAFDLARRLAGGRIETLHALPADLVAEAAESDPSGQTLQVHCLQPQAPAPGLLASSPLPLWPLLGKPGRGKPETGLWLDAAGWAEHLAGRCPSGRSLVRASALWQLDRRVGLGLDAQRLRAAEGQLFSVQAVAFQEGVGFLAGVRGAEPPAAGLLRLGGDGRGAALHSVRHQPARPDLAAIARAGRCRLVLTTPGLFAGGWRLPGVDAQNRLALPGVQARLVCAAVPTAQTVSGWDLALRQPKPAQRVAPTGSVYWLDELRATPEAIGKLADQGLWADAAENASRRAEGFNRFSLAVW